MPDRRSLLGLSAGALLATLPSLRLSAAQDASQSAPTSGGIRLDLPDLAENGASVMITVEVASAMQGTDFTKSVTIIAPANPTRQVAQFHFSELSGRAIVTTNIRLADSQEVTAIAEMADGSTRIARKFIQVTVGGCNT